MIDREKGIWSEFAEEELQNNQEWADNGLPEINPVIFISL